MVHRVAFTRLLFAGSHSAPVMPPGATLDTHTGRARMCPARHIPRYSVVRPCHILLSRQEVTPPPQAGSLRQGSSKGIFFPHWWRVFPCSPMAAAGFPICQHSHTLMPDSGNTPEPAANVPWTSKEVIIVERTRKCPGIPLPPCTSVNLALWPWHSWSQHRRDRPAPGAAPAGKCGCVLPPRGGGYGLRSLKCQTTRRSLEIHLSPLPLGAARAGRLWR